MGRAAVADDGGYSAELIDAVLGASRVLVAMAARSIAAVTDDVTVPQYRALVILVTQGPQRIADIAQQLEVEPSTATRMSDRLARKGLVIRESSADDRRVVVISASDAGRALVASVTRKRRNEIRNIVKRMPPETVPPTIAALRAFNQASEAAGDGWWLGWTTESS